MAKDIFVDPHFYIEGMTANDVRQGRDGDCWFISSICTLSNKEDLLERVCVVRDEKVGVYGFVFHRGMQQSFSTCDAQLLMEGQMASGSQRSSTTNSTWPNRISTSRSGISIIGSKSTCPIQMTSIERSCKRAPRHSTSRNAGIRMKPGFPCSKKPMPRLTVIMRPLRVVGLGKEVLLIKPFTSLTCTTEKGSRI